MDRLDLDGFISTARDALIGATDILWHYFDSADNLLDARSKADRSVVTAADFDSEELILESLGAYRDLCSIHSEEAGESHNSNAQYRILIDPLDGTSNFSRFRSGFGLCIALADTSTVNNEIVAVVSCEPASRRMWTATTKSNTRMEIVGFQGPREVVVSKRSPDRGDICVDASTTPRKTFKSVSNKSAIVGLLIQKYKRFRMIGSNVVAHALVANGSFEAAITDTVGGPFDTAGYLLVERAGGQATNLNGDPVNVFSDEVVVSTNGVAHDELLESLQKLYGHW